MLGKFRMAGTQSMSCSLFQESHTLRGGMMTSSSRSAAEPRDHGIVKATEDCVAQMAFGEVDDLGVEALGFSVDLCGGFYRFLSDLVASWFGFDLVMTTDEFPAVFGGASVAILTRRLASGGA